MVSRHAILEAKNEVLDFNQLLVEIQEYTWN